MANLKLFGRDGEDKPSIQDVAKQYAPGTQLAYDPELPDRLRRQHREILDLLQNTVAAARDGKYRHVENMLTEFQHGYRNHRFERNQRFIPYMNHCLANNKGHSELILKINSVTRHLDQRVITTVEKHKESGVADQNRDEFIEELEQIHSDLRKHMREEDEFIYPMYQPPEKYSYP
jgi:iron-sulfur cluster repair protein YtfE (RIC family)